MESRRIFRWTSLLTTAVVATNVAGCSEDLAQRASECFSDVTGYSSPAAGVLTLQGHFYDTESILVRDAGTHVQVAGGTPATDRTSFTFINIPSGTHSYEVIASCNSGQITVFSQTFVIQ